MDQELTRLLRKAGEDARALAAVSGRLGASARHLRQRPFAELTETLPRVARDVAKDIGKQVRVVVTGGEIEADRVVLEALREPLLHLVRNAVDHGIELPAARMRRARTPRARCASRARCAAIGFRSPSPTTAVVSTSPPCVAASSGADAPCPPIPVL